MSRFRADSQKLEEAVTRLRQLYGECDDLSNNIYSEYSRVNAMSGAGVNDKAYMLNNSYNELGDYSVELKAIAKSLDTIATFILSREMHNEGILQNGRYNTETYEQQMERFNTFYNGIKYTASEKKYSISHEDMGKIIDEIRYYTQMYAHSEDVFDYYFVKRYNSGGMIELTQTEYIELHTLYNMYKNIGEGFYTYSGWIFGDTNSELGINSKTSGSLDPTNSKWKNSTSFDASAKWSATAAKYVYKVKYDAENSWIGKTDIIVDFGKVSGEVIAGIDIDVTSKIQDVLNDNKTSVDEKRNTIQKIMDEMVSPGIKADAKVTVASINTKSTRVDSNGNGAYSVANVKIGEAGVDGSINTNGFDIGAHATAIEIESGVGAIIQNHEIGAQGTAKAGVSIGAKAKWGENGIEAKTQAGPFALAINYKAPSIKSNSSYVWLY